MQYLIIKVSIREKTYLVGKRVAVLLHRKKLIWKHRVLYHTEQNGQILNGLSVPVFMDFSRNFLWIYSKNQFEPDRSRHMKWNANFQPGPTHCWKSAFVNKWNNFGCLCDYLNCRLMLLNLWIVPKYKSMAITIDIYLVQNELLSRSGSWVKLVMKWESEKTKVK